MRIFASLWRKVTPPYAYQREMEALEREEMRADVIFLGDVP